MDDADFLPTSTTILRPLSPSSPDDPVSTSDGFESRHHPPSRSSSNEQTVVDENLRSIDEQSLTMEERLTLYKARKERQKQSQQRRKAGRRPRWSSVGSAGSAGTGGRRSGEG